MGLRTILGSPGTGKTQLCIKEMIEASRAKPGGDFIYIVPEQFSLQAERELTGKTAGRAMIDIQVLSFDRLAYHILNEVGGNEKKILEDVGKGMLLKKIVGDLKNELSFFSGAVDKQGFMAQLQETVTEFYRYRITTEKLDEMISSIHHNETLRLKMTDLQKILEKYQQYQAEHYIDSDEKLDVLAEKILFSNKIKNAKIWVDGFVGFTPQELNVLRKLLLAAQTVTITLAVDGKTAAQKDTDLNYFSEIKQTVKKINEIVTENNIPWVENILLSENIRLKDSPEIRHLAENFLQHIPEKYADEVSAIKLRPAENIYAEIENAAAEILTVVREKGWRFREIGILACSLPAYGKSIKAIFDRYQIPVFIDIKTDILSHPLIELIRSAFSIFVERWSYESVFRFLKTNLSPLSRADIDLCENYVLANGIKGRKWQKPWVYGFQSTNEVFEPERMNALRETVVAVLSPLCDAYKTHKKYTVRAITESLILFLESMGVGQKLSEWTEAAFQNGDVRLAKEHAQIWGKLLLVCEKMVEILGTEKVTVEEYLKIIDAGFSSLDLGAIPPTLDQVVVGDLRRSRLPEIKALFVLGMGEGLLPARFGDSGLLSDEDRVFIKKNHRQDLSPNLLMKAYQEYFLIQSVLSKPSEKIYLSYYTGGLDGKSSLPSPVVQKIQAIFPALTVIENARKNDFSLVSKRFAYGDLLNRLPQFKEEGVLPEFYKDMYSFLLCDKDYHHKINKIAKEQPAATEAVLEKDTVAGLYGGALQTSVSRLEKYISCPFSYYMQYNLKAAERKLYEIESLDLGNLFHDALENFSNRIQKENIDWRGLGEEEIHAIANDAIDQSLERDTNEIFRNTPQFQYFAGRAKQIALKSVDAVMTHMKNGAFEFSFTEAAFGSDSELGEIHLPLGGGVLMVLHGRIDRVDLLTEGGSQYVKIIDYKSGHKTFSFPEIFYGLQLQLIIYLDAFIKKFKEKYPKKSKIVLPAAVLYFRLDNPMIHFSELSKKDAIADALYKKFKMSGVVLEDIGIIKSLDANFDSKSDIIPVGIKASGAFKKLPPAERPLTETSSVLSEKEFQELMDFCINKATETGDRILTGDINAAPYQYKSMSGCTFCRYQAVCRFDAVLDKNHYCLMPPIKSQEARVKILGRGIDKTKK